MRASTWVGVKLRELDKELVIGNMLFLNFFYCHSNLSVNNSHSLPLGVIRVSSSVFH
mgnify:CR=1 FL=1